MEAQTDVQKKDVFEDLETLIQEAPQENALIREINQNFAEVYLPKLSNLTHSLDTFTKNQKQLDDSLGLTELAPHMKVYVAVRNLWGGKALSLEDLYEMQKKCLEYMRTTLDETLHQGKQEGDKLSDYAQDLLLRLRRAEGIMQVLGIENSESVPEEGSVYERAQVVVQQQDNERKSDFGATRLQQFMKGQLQHYQDVRNLVGALREVVEVYTLVHDQVVVGEQNLEVVMVGYQLVDQAKHMSPLYGQGLQQLRAFGGELQTRLQDGVKRLSALRSVAVRGYVS